MEHQKYSNHVRYYVPHHFIYYPVMFLLTIIAARSIVVYPQQSREWTLITAILIVVTWLSYMVRQHYALTLQNRVIRLELRLRYYQLTGDKLENFESDLSLGQIAALRFASDEELTALVHRAYNDALSPDAIKKLIKNWLPDNNRV